MDEIHEKPWIISFLSVAEFRMFKTTAAWLFVLSLSVMVGCGSDSGHPKTYKVSGTVKLGGKPVDGALVTFIPSVQGAKPAIGSTNASGEFKLSTFGPSDGAVAGDYKVTITKISSPPANAPQALQPGVITSGEISDSYAPPTTADSSKGGNANKNLLPAKYASDANSGLIATVAENDNNKFDFDL